MDIFTYHLFHKNIYIKVWIYYIPNLLNRFSNFYPFLIEYTKNWQIRAQNKRLSMFLVSKLYRVYNQIFEIFVVKKNAIRIAVHTTVKIEDKQKFSNIVYFGGF